MKKCLFIAALVVAGFVSCTKDTEDLQLQESKASAMRLSSSLQDLYDDMLDLQEYKDFENTVDAFLVKMGPDAENEEFEDEAEILDWIDTNLSKTTFASYNDAVTKWGEVKGEFELVNNKIPELIDNDFDDNEWDELIIPGDGDWGAQYEAYSDDPCVFGCINTAVEAGKEADKAYKAGMRKAYKLARLNPAGGAIVASLVSINHSLAQSRIAKNLKSCACGCNPALCDD